MDSKNFHLYNLRVGSRTSAVRTVKRLLHSRLDISYRNDGSSIYTPQLSSAVGQIQRTAGITSASGVVDEETWAALGRGMQSHQLRLIVAGSGDDHQLYGLLVGASLGGGLRTKANNAVIFSNDDETNTGVTFTITVNNVWAVYNDFGSQEVSSEAEDILNDATGRLATNIFRAMVTYRALADNPKTKITYKVEGTVGLGAKGKKIAPTSGEITVGAEFETLSGDSILQKLTIANDDIRAFLVDALKKQEFFPPGRDNTLQTLRLMGDVPALNAPNIASNFGLTAKTEANRVARQQHKDTYPEPDKDIPATFKLNYY